MKKILLLMVALACVAMSYAQSQTATLLHGSDIKTYFGISSLASAIAEAEDGDIITLSAGHFKAANITKAIALRGAGMVEYTDASINYLPTLIEGELTVQIPENTDNRLKVEGVKFSQRVYCNGTLSNPSFQNCNFSDLYVTNNAKVKNGSLIHCRVSNSLRIYDNSNFTCINSIIRRPYSSTASENSTFEFVNCVLTHVIPNYKTGYYSGSGTDWFLTYSSFKNCYIYVDSTYEYYTPFASNSVVTNCHSNYADMFKNVTSSTNKITDARVFFQSFEGGEWNDSQKFELKDETAAMCLGDDGTQIGIYGGNMPYEERIAMPRITICNVAGKSTADGKLSVEIQVEAAH